MKEILGRLQTAYEELLGKLSAADRKALELADREGAVFARENRVRDIESAKVVLADAEEKLAKANAALKEIEEKKAEFDNHQRVERAQIASEIARLQPLQDQEKQLFKEKQEFYAQKEALEKEKKEFKVRFIEKIKAHFAATKGEAPDPNAIT